MHEQIADPGVTQGGGQRVHIRLGLSSIDPRVSEPLRVMIAATGRRAGRTRTFDGQRDPADRYDENHTDQHGSDCQPNPPRPAATPPPSSAPRRDRVRVGKFRVASRFVQQPVLKLRVTYHASMLPCPWHTETASLRRLNSAGRGCRGRGRSTWPASMAVWGRRTYP